MKTNLAMIVWKKYGLAVVNKMKEKEVLAVGWWVVKKLKMKSEKLKIGLVSLLAVGAVLVAGWLVWNSQLFDGILVSKYCEKDGDCTFTQCCGCASMCHKICSEKPFALPCECENNQCVVKQTQQVTITTDKTAYEQGETVKIIARNGLERSVWYFRGCGEARFWSLNKLEENKWKTMTRFFLPDLVEERVGLMYREALRMYKEVCDPKLCERLTPLELKSNFEINHNWQLGSICEWPESPIGFPKVEPKPIEEGTYRVSFTYGLSKDEEGFGLLEEKTIYSNEFMIKEKPVAQKDPRCLMPKPTEIGGCKVLRGFYYDASSNECKPIGGCKVEGEIPFNGTQKQECIQICVEK